MPKHTMFTAGLAVAGAVIGYGVYSYVQQYQKHKITAIVDEIMSELSKGPVLISDPVGLRNKLHVLLEGGAQQLQCITDFDGTLTRGSLGGKKTQTSFAVVNQSALLPEGVKTQELELRAKYLPIERASDLSKAEKAPHMEKWWREVFDNLKEAGLKKCMLRKMIKDGTSVLREGCAYVLKKFHDENVPVLIFSAGIGDVVQEVIYQQAYLYDNISIVSNFIDWNEEGNMKGVLPAADSVVMHSFNKGVIAVAIDYKDTVEGRGNVILLGDNEGDGCTLKALKNVKTSLQIGFLNDNVDDLRKSFEELYDIVIADAESMAIVGVLLMKLFDRE